MIPAEPPLYMEKGDLQPGLGPDGYWYYCENPEGYYPYVNECLNGWRAVMPTPLQE